MIPVSTKTESNYAPVPEGNHIARIYSIIHIGTTEKETQWGLKQQNKIRITWELLNEMRDFKGEMKPLVISQEYTISFSEKANLRKMIDGLLGKEALNYIEDETFDIESLLGRYCMVNIKHETKGEKTYANVLGVAPVPKGMALPDKFNEDFILNYSDKWDVTKFEKLPDFIKDKMKESDEYKALTTEVSDDNDSPF